LRQCISYIPLLAQAIEGYEENPEVGRADIAEAIRSYQRLEEPAKVTFLEKLLQEYKRKKEKVVIWANFIGTLKYLKAYLLSKGYKCDLIIGETPIENSLLEQERTREIIRAEFVDPESGLDILLANPAACAESISLHKTCHNAIYYDLSYNCAQYLQSLDRIHRVGGSEEVEVNYYFLQYKDTMENDIKDNLEVKARRMSQLIDEDIAVYSMDMFEDDDEDAAFERVYGNESK
jgi:SNF2 family DNA or RNA helicase